MGTVGGFLRRSNRDGEREVQPALALHGVCGARDVLPFDAHMLGSLLGGIGLHDINPDLSLSMEGDDELPDQPRLGAPLSCV